MCTTRTKEYGDRADEEETGTAGNGRVDGEINEAADTGDERLEGRENDVEVHTPG